VLLEKNIYKFDKRQSTLPQIDYLQGMIHREVIPEKPPKTLYSLTAFGKSIIPVLDSMCNWGIHFLEGLDITPP